MLWYNTFFICECLQEQVDYLHCQEQSDVIIKGVGGVKSVAPAGLLIGQVA